MYVINKEDDGHVWQKYSKKEQPKKSLGFKKLYCVFCGAKAYTVGKTKLSLTGEYYNGEIRQCPGGAIGFVNTMKDVLKKKKKKKKKKKMVRGNTMVRTK